MTAGVSTGSILAAGFSKPKMIDSVTKGDCNKEKLDQCVSSGKPRFYAEELVDIYKTKGDKIFQKYTLSGASTFLYLFLFTVAFSALFYWIGLRMYDSQDARWDLSLMQIAIQNARRRKDPNFKP
jgi:hypothetical protein